MAATDLPPLDIGTYTLTKDALAREIKGWVSYSLVEIRDMVSKV